MRASGAPARAAAEAAQRAARARRVRRTRRPGAASDGEAIHGATETVGRRIRRGRYCNRIVPTHHHRVGYRRHNGSRRAHGQHRRRKPQEPDALLRTWLSGVGQGDRRGARRRADAGRRLRVRQRRDLRTVQGLGTRFGRLRGAVGHARGQHLGHGDPDHGGRAEAGLGQADHRGAAVLPVRPAGQEAPRPGADLGPAGRGPAEDRRREPDPHRRPAHRADPGLLRRPGGPPLRDGHPGRVRASTSTPAGR